MMPERIQLSRRRGWRMPDNTVKVDRSTKWGNPFVVGQDGTRQECVEQFNLLLGGYIVLTCKATIEAQQAYAAMVRRDLEELRGKSLACWCPIGAPCHAETLLKIANRPVCEEVAA